MADLLVDDSSLPSCCVADHSSALSPDSTIEFVTTLGAPASPHIGLSLSPTWLSGGAWRRRRPARPRGRRLRRPRAHTAHSGTTLREHLSE
ncbi:hypothetical protein Rrhod_3831 [Rhodococcus rhodnii LMG 5362]|uniref:Uncharacterized protein n=1 Tax=Rhodococcus rhodnii LMG 5362 TaxID=1273125 RepID=R7WI49_9NOCA|nr:hypothetical protein Rrhod_3831 [Rhodococcus rhodnii LMG 5362]